MGYDVYITRREQWYSEDGPEITLQEWQALLASDPDLVTLEDGETAQLVHPDGHYARTFWHSRGYIFVKKPNRAALMKMLKIAETLGARVIGDHDEVYSKDGTPDKVVDFIVIDGW